MTGEITLTGLVLPIGGLKEKCLAAYRYGFNELIVPADNKKDLADLPPEMKNRFKFHAVERVEEVFNRVFPASSARRTRARKK